MRIFVLDAYLDSQIIANACEYRLERPFRNAHYFIRYSVVINIGRLKERVDGGMCSIAKGMGS